MGKWAFLNDRFVAEENTVLHARDLAVQRGYGVFDFFKLIHSVPVFLEEHLDRFYFSSAQMRLPVVYSKDELRKIIFELLEKNNIDHTGVRITLTGGYSEDGYQLSSPNLIISLHSFASPDEDLFKKGIKLVTYPHQRQLPHVKSIDYLMAIWLQPFIKQNGADDVLYHLNGVVSECPRSNFFIVTKDDTILTPSSNILNGVMRMKLIETAKKYFIITERNIVIEDIKSAKEAFITSTTKTILPVRQIDNSIFPDSRPVTTQLYHLMLQVQQTAAQPA
jgi:branched-chain amino acid aminotransferase